MEDIMQGIIVERFDMISTEQEQQELIDIASQNFSGMQDLLKAEMWFDCNLRARPRMKYFVARLGESIVGYILWVEKGGFRKEGSVWELEQIAVKKELQAKGIGCILIIRSFHEIHEHVKKRGSWLKKIEVTTGVANEAQRLYVKAFEMVSFELETMCIAKDLFRGDEALLFFRPK